MKNILFILLIQFVFFQSELKAQIENVIVEKYYISDANDATDTTGGYLEAGSITYRIFIDMMPGTKLRKIYGDVNHALKISSTQVFFNNKVDGQTFGKDFSKNRLDENTVALDTWLTLGQITRVSSKTYFGVLKNSDDDGSFIGGVNNDGGSQMIPGGLLDNNDPAMGLPLTTSDGFDTMTTFPSTWVDFGIIDSISHVDSTIFGSVNSCSQFISNNAWLQNLGVTGVNPDSNLVLVAQLTTKGEITFELNLEVEEIFGTNTRIVKYVADGSTLLSDERISPFLKYPQSCGCTDPNYLEYNAGYACENIDSCKTRIILGCMDSLACNYDPEANFNIQDLCCYPGYCNDRDISVVCPQLSTNKFNQQQLELYPNPSGGGQIYIRDFLIEKKNVRYIIYDALGKLLLEKNMGIFSGRLNEQVDISGFENGLYLFRIYEDEESISKIFIKE